MLLATVLVIAAQTPVPDAPIADSPAVSSAQQPTTDAPSPLADDVPSGEREGPAAVTEQSSEKVGTSISSRAARGLPTEWVIGGSRSHCRVPRDDGRSGGGGVRD